MQANGSLHTKLKVSLSKRIECGYCGKLGFKIIDEVLLGNDEYKKFLDVPICGVCLGKEVRIARAKNK